MDLTPLTHSLRNWLKGSDTRPHIGPELGDYIHSHRMNAFLYHIDASMSESVAQAAEAKWHSNTLAYLARIAALKAAWPDDVVVPVLMKGADYNENLYHDPGARQAADLDLLVPVETYGAVTTQVRSDGIRSTEGSDGTKVGLYSSTGFEVQGCLLEVHSAPDPWNIWSMQLETLHGRVIPGYVDNFQVNYPHPLDRFLIWLINQAKSGFTDGLWARLDFAVILRDLVEGDGTVSWRELQALATESDLGNTYRLSVHLLAQSEIWPFEMPTAPGGVVPWARRLGMRGDSPMKRPHPFRKQSLKLWLCPTKKRWRFLRSLANRARLENSV